MTGANYYKEMKKLFDIMRNGSDHVRKIDLLNRFIYEHGLNLDTGRRKFEDAITINVIEYCGRDKEGFELIRVKCDD